jgi:hypothetical protein
LDWKPPKPELCGRPSSTKNSKQIDIVPVHTATSLREIHRRQDRQAAVKYKVLDAMRRGAALHRQQVHGHIQWRLSDGTRVLPQAALNICRDLRVRGEADCLFGAELSQTFRLLAQEN